jgi:parallel beta-helix repeat protein
VRQAVRIATATFLCMLGMTALAAPASAEKINVHPGPNALQSALSAADDGDTLRIHRGHYHVLVLEIEKRVKLVGVGKRRPVIDGDCDSGVTISVRHAGVVLRRLKVIGADEAPGFAPSAVAFFHIRTGRAENLVLRDTCGGAEYGINLFDGGPIKLENNVAKGYSDAGLYVGGITNTRDGVLRLKNNEAYGNNRGIIVEDSLRRTDIRVIGNRVHGNDLPGFGFRSGIFVSNSDGVLFRRNRANRNGKYGIHLDASSDHNRLFDNEARRNGDRNFFDEGSGNCGSGNSFGLSHC